MVDMDELLIQNTEKDYGSLQCTGPQSGHISYSQLHKLIHDIHDYNVMELRKNTMLGYIFLILVYVGINIGLLGVNFKSQEFIDENYYMSFHLLSFWAVFAFTLLETFILLFTEMVSTSHLLLSGVVIFNVVATLSTAIIFTIDPRVYEVIAHYMEYCVQVGA